MCVLRQLSQDTHSSAKIGDYDYTKAELYIFFTDWCAMMIPIHVR